MGMEDLSSILFYALYFIPLFGYLIWTIAVQMFCREKDVVNG